MSSKSFRNTLSVIGIARSISERLTDSIGPNSRNKVMTGLIKKLNQASDNALVLWPGEIDIDTLKLIGKRLKKLERHKHIGRHVDIVIYLSLAIGLLEDLLAHLSGKDKIQKIKALIHALMAILKYYDRKIAKFEMYDKASLAIKYWNSLEA